MSITHRAICLLVAAGSISGCGGGDDYANKPRPPAPINVTASITDRGVTVSPKQFGAGPVVFIIANQTGAAQAVTLETDELGGSKPGIRQKTSPINPMGTATLKVDMREGTYAVRTSGDGIKPATVSVQGRRKSAQNELLQP
jgi:hypothetical protein